MKSNNIDRSVILAEYAPKASAKVTNEFVSNFSKGHEDIILFGCINFENRTPYEEQGRHAVEELGMKGFKRLPSYQHFYPNDQAPYPFYEYVQSLGMPIMFHIGTSIFHGTRIKYADPLLLDEVADDFPGLNISMETRGKNLLVRQGRLARLEIQEHAYRNSGNRHKAYAKNFPEVGTI